MIDFNLNQVQHIEFGVGLDTGKDQSFYNMTADRDTQDALREMAEATWDVMQSVRLEPHAYEPSEKYASLDYVALPLNSDLTKQMRDLHEAVNLPKDNDALADPIKVFCYFARMTDEQGRGLTGLRRATHFKGVVRSRLIRFATDALKFIQDPVFKLDHDFDLLVDSSTIHILRPSGFEAAGKLQEVVLAAVPQNVATIQDDLAFVDFANILDYASKRPRAARYLASIRTDRLAEGIDRSSLQELCDHTGVQVSDVNGKIMVEDGHIMGFLEVLDRRRYELELVRGSPEFFRAAGRKQLNK